MEEEETLELERPNAQQALRRRNTKGERGPSKADAK